MSVSRARREIDSREFAEWMAYSLVEPFGPGREDERAGAIAAVVANVNRDASRRSQPFEPLDFLSRYSPIEDGVEAAPTEVNLKSKLEAWVAAMAKTNAPGRPKSELRERRRRGGRGG